MTRRTYTFDDYRRDLARLDGIRRGDAPGLSALLAEKLIADADLVPPASAPPSSAPPVSGVVLRRPTHVGGFARLAPATAAVLRAVGLGARPRTTLR